MPRYIITDKDPHRFGNGTLKAGDEYEIANEAEAAFFKRGGYLEDPPPFPPRTQRAPRRAAVEPTPEAVPEAAAEPERSSLPITHHEAEVAPIAAEVTAVAEAHVIRATDQEVDPAPSTDDPSRYERRDMRPEE